MANPPIPRYTYIFTIFREEATSTLAGFHASPMILVELEFGNVGFCGRKGKPDRNPPNKAGTNDKLALVEDERSHHYSIPAICSNRQSKAVFTLNVNYIQLNYDSIYHTPFDFIQLWFYSHLRKFK